MTQTLYFPGLNWQIDLNPVAFQIGPITANWYGVIIAAGGWEKRRFFRIV